MYARYDYNAGATAANVIADIAKILTGTTDKSLLSAACAKATTDIVATVPAGWTLVDDATGTANEIVVSAPCALGIKPKLARILANTTQLTTWSLETWNAATNVAANQAGGVGTSTTLSGANTIYIAATERYLFLMGVNAGVSGNPVGVCELKPGTPYAMEANGLPPAANVSLPNSFGQNSSSAYLPRCKTITGTDTANVYLQCVTLLYACGTAGGGTYQMLNADLVSTSPPVVPVWFGAYTSNASFIGEMYGVKHTINSLGSNQDEVTSDGKTYRIWPSGSMRWLIPKE
jgi:hypothetical protein